MASVEELTEELKSGTRRVTNPVRRRTTSGNSGSASNGDTSGNGNDTGADTGGGGSGSGPTDGGTAGADSTPANVGGEHVNPAIIAGDSLPPIQQDNLPGNPSGNVGQSVDTGGGENRGAETGRSGDSGETEVPRVEHPVKPVADGTLRLSVPNVPDPTKNKGGRPRKDGLPVGSGTTRTTTSAKPKQEEIPAEVCTYLMQWGFAMLHTARPWGNWYRTPEQCQPAGEAMAQCLKRLPAKYADKVMDVMPFFALGMNLFALVAPSIAEEQEAYKRAKLAATNPPPNIGGQGPNLGGFPTGANLNGTGNTSAKPGGNLSF